MDDPSIALQIRNRVFRFGIRERYPKKGRGKGEVNWKFRKRNFVVIERSSRSRANESSRDGRVPARLSPSQGRSVSTLRGEREGAARDPFVRHARSNDT